MSNPVHSSVHRHLPGLDGLRGVACLMVFAVHFNQIAKLDGRFGSFQLSRLLENGNIGVALFFALSGFLLSLPYWRALVLGSQMPATSSFLVRRIARVVPAYFLCLTALIVVNRLWQEEGFLRDAALHYAFAFNYFDDTIFSINPPFWTVAVEMQFYLVLPFVFFTVKRFKPAFAALCIALMALGAYAAHLMIAGAMPNAIEKASQVSPVITYSLLAHLPHFFFGILTAWLFNSRKSPCWSPSVKVVPTMEISLWLAIFLLLVVLGTPLDESFQIPYGRYNLPYIPLLLCAVILLTPLTATGWILLQMSPLRAVGTVSYGVYIYHLPVLHLVARLMERHAFSSHENWFMFVSVSLAVTLVIATVSFYIFEKPILNFVAKWRCSTQARK